MKKCNYCDKEHENENTGCNNSGHYNSGHYNSGHYNSGHYNSGDYNSGWFNTDEPNMRFFGKESNIKRSEFNVKVHPDLKICSWIEVKDLPKDEQSESARQMGGLLKTLTYHEAWREYWNRAKESDKAWFKSLPNFNAKMFEEITGINVEVTETITIGGITYSKKEVEERLKDIKAVN